MNGFVLTGNVILALLPVIAIQLGLLIYCTIKIFTEGVQNLNKWAWFFICLLINFFGPIIFLIIGRKKDIQ